MNLFELSYQYFKELFKDAKCELNFNNSLELLIAVILSAQCTDKRVNEVTANLFKIAKTPQDFIELGQDKLERFIYSCGFYHNKAKHIINCCKQIVDNFNGIVPNNVEDLQKLDGVGRKTANVVYATAFNGDAIAVDTHVFRVSNRLGLVNAKNVKQTEIQLMNIVPQNKWSAFHYYLVLFGRYYCKARNPECNLCKLKDNCKYFKEKNNVCR